MMLIGLIWAFFAPAVFVILFFILNRYFFKSTSFSSGSQRYRFIIVIALSPLILIWLPERIKFEQVCRKYGTPIIYKKVKTEGFFLDGSTANSFGMRYLHDDGFKWIEAKSIYNRNEFVRYEKNDQKIDQKEISAVTSEYIVKTENDQNIKYFNNKMTISHKPTNELLAVAYSFRFDGGYLKWFVGMWGTASCPSAMTNPDDFRQMYRLVKNTLNAD